MFDVLVGLVVFGAAQAWVSSVDHALLVQFCGPCTATSVQFRSKKVQFSLLLGPLFFDHYTQSSVQYCYVFNAILIWSFDPLTLFAMKSKRVAAHVLWASL